ncbi:MAG: PQQ-binding-like beta-propeller repeat protein [Bacteroides sp.]|nr:PQQ-binding-like beta-propeller repeat protein [Bacteroides sp.]
MQRGRLRSFSLITFLTLSFSLSAQKATPSWTHFRGNHLDGISEEKGLPLSWDDSTNIAWKTAIDGKGWSSPVVLGEQVWLTTATSAGKEMRAVCLDFKTGEIIHNLIMFNPDSLNRIHAINSYATPTSAIEIGFVYVHFGRYGTACLNTNTGETVWERKDMQVEHIQGPASSLLIYKDKLIVHMEGSDIQYIVALDKKTGKTIWKTERPKELYDHLEYIGKKTYITPIIVETNGRYLLISNGSAACIAYDPESGKEVWRIVYGEDSTIAMPTEENGIIYYYTGLETDSSGERRTLLLAVDPNGEGDIQKTNILWSVETPILQLLSPLVKDGLLYTVDSRGDFLCLDTSDGTTLWSEGMKGKFHSSPVYCNGNLYFSSTRGYTYVLEAGREKTKFTENKLEGEIWATPAIAGGAILIRTSKYLYKIAYPWEKQN